MCEWDIRFLRLAHEVSTWSKDPGTTVGSILVKDRRILSQGFNGFPRGISDDLRYLDRDFKLEVVVHSELNAILNAAKNGVSIDGASLYVTFPPCTQCASAVIQAGVVEVICPDPDTAPERWKSNFVKAQGLFAEAGVTVLYYSGEIVHGGLQQEV